MQCLHNASDAEVMGTLQPTHEAFLVMNFAMAPTLLCVMILDLVWSPSVEDDKALKSYYTSYINIRIEV